jgi:putative colanic acid biosynthesis acetyltransferase WcaF
MSDSIDPHEQIHTCTPEEQRQAELAEAAANQAMATHVLPPRDRIFLPQTWRERVVGFWWSVVRSTVFRWSLSSMHRWRVMLLRLFGASVDLSARIEPTVRIEFPWNLTIGSQAVLCDRVIINCMGRVRIGDRTRISQYSHLISGTHNYRSGDMQIERRPVNIGADVWIAADAFVGPGVTLGDGCVLAARSSAFRDLPAGQICVGEPARPVHARATGHDSTELDRIVAADII